MNNVNNMKKILIWVILLCLLCSLIVPPYVYMLERADAVEALAKLTQVTVAENQYFLEHKKYTPVYDELEKLLPPQVQLRGQWNNPSSARNGFAFLLQLSQDAASGTLHAQHKGFFSYTLSDSFPMPAFACTAVNFAGKYFCRRFEKEVKDFMLSPEKHSETENKK